MRYSALAFACVLLLPAIARADADVQRLLDAKRTLHWNVTPPGKTQRYGHAEALVGAPVEKVKATALDFAHYKELHRKFASARVVGKDGDSTDVYMKLPVKVGPFRIDQWSVIRFGPPCTRPGGGFVIEGREVKGNMKDGHVVLTMRAVDAKHSVLAVDLFLVPSIPAPSSMIDEELRDGALDLVNGLKDRAQGWVGAVTAL